MPQFKVFVERKVLDVGEIIVTARGLESACKKVKELIKSEELVIEHWENSAVHFRPFGGQAVDIHLADAIDASEDEDAESEFA